MEGMGWMMGGMALVWILFIILLVLAIAALVKFLRNNGRPERQIGGTGWRKQRNS